MNKKFFLLSALITTIIISCQKDPLPGNGSTSSKDSTGGKPIDSSYYSGGVSSSSGSGTTGKDSIGKKPADSSYYTGSGSSSGGVKPKDS